MSHVALPMPVGVLGRLTITSEDLLPLMGGMESSLQPDVVAYLRSGYTVFAIMEQTSDKIGSKFSVAGGSAILTDGMYYWRRDAANYVEHYRVGLPREFLDHAQANGWKVPALGQETINVLGDRLYATMRHPQPPSTYFPC